mmetsp:Transcript_36043/g.77954  ORF Transcript_36043/g.77954 Transcript_36043/m.77954 type:complete len:228 (-) Transcript_36043:70-753(-)
MENQSKKIKITESGKAMKTNLAKGNSGASGQSTWYWSKKMPLVGVPTGVAMPPMLALQPTAKSTADLKEAYSSGSCFRNECTTGIMQTAVAVLEIHMLNAQTAIMKPASKASGRLPVLQTTKQMIRMCNPHRSMAKPMMKPPMKRKEVPPKNLLANAPGVATASKGYRTMGKRLLTVRGRTSVNHHRATMSKTAKPREARGRCSSRSTLRQMIRIKADSNTTTPFLW